MADSGLTAWFEQWTRDDDERWSILDELANADETVLRSLLRPHEEAGVGGGEAAPRLRIGGRHRTVAELRRELDDALDALTYIEIGFQLGVLPVRSAPSEGRSGELNRMPDRVQKSLSGLARSEAFLRYLDVYLFFGIRFLAARGLALPHEEPKNLEDGLPALRGQINRPSLPLVTPPALVTLPEHLLQALDEMVGERSSDEEVALSFLDGFRQKRVAENTQAEEEEPPRHQKVHEPYLLELWLRGLVPELEGQSAPPNEAGLSSKCIAPEPPDKDEGDRLAQIARGIESWARRRAKLYLLLRDVEQPPEPAAAPSEQRSEPRDAGPEITQERPGRGWRCDTPAAARLALADLYWLAGILRADISHRGEVTYTHVSWLGLLRYKASLECKQPHEEELQKIEEILRSVFSIACELIQNAAELRDQRDRTDADHDGCFDERQGQKQQWRSVFDWEMETIGRQRTLRDYGTPHDQPRREPPDAGDEIWSKRITTGEHQRNLIGLALSGGGIRSATFCLGVLQGLQRLDLLRQVDYLSTVSGGGYLGAWLLGNVRRSRYWLGSLAPWEQSIKHLRAYSNYLAPRTGILSMDTWSLGALWVRNTLLIQLTALAWLLSLFTAVYMGRMAFLGVVYSAPSGAGVLDPSKLLALLMGAAVLSMVLASFVPRGATPGDIGAERWRWAAMSPVLVASVVVLVLAARLALFQTPWTALWDLVLELQHWAFYATLMPITAILAPCVMAGVVLWLGRNHKLSCLSNTFAIRWLAVLPACLAGAILGGHLFSMASLGTFAHFLQSQSVPASQDFSVVLKWGCRREMWGETLLYTWIAFFLVCLGSLYAASLDRSRHRRQQRALRAAEGFAGAIAIAVVCTGVVHLCFSAIVYGALHLQHAMVKRQPGFDSVGFLTVPGLVLLSYTAGLLLMIGLLGRYSNESQREWWTRFGGWVLVYALLAIAVPAAVFGGPWLIHVKGHLGWFHWGGLVTWLGTVVSGLFAGKSSKTSGAEKNGSPSLQVLAKVAGAAFLIGAAVLSAEVLYLFFRALFDVAPNGVSLTIAETHWPRLLVTLCVLLFISVIFSKFFDINIFGVNQLYRNRLVRCFLGATRWRPRMRSPEPFTRFDFRDDLQLTDLGPVSKDFEEFRGPFPLVNCSLNLSGSADLALHTRHSASFTLTPLCCGSDRPLVGYAATRRFAGGVSLGQAVSISGAAASPNMGYNTSPLVAFLLTMFNVRLGWWFPNPGRRQWRKTSPNFSLYYLLKELMGEAGEARNFINVSDGGHFENLGIYELVRRGCKVIIACDAECDESLDFGGLANAVRLCAVDFGAKIDIDVSSIHTQTNGSSLLHASVGTIRYSNGSIGRLIYLKASISGDEDVSVKQYRSAHPSFPHESTADQFFSEDQFESYRRLGEHVVAQSFRGVAPGERLMEISERLADMLTPASAKPEVMLQYTRRLEDIWTSLRRDFTTPAAASFFSELMGLNPGVTGALNQEVTCVGLELLQFMEDVFIALRLDDFWEHPDNRGWAMLFMNWARSPRMRQVWKGNHRTFGIPFEYFCDRRLGLYRDDPVMRVSPLPRE